MFEDWNLIRIASKLLSTTREIAELESQIANYSAGSWSTATKAKTIAELQRELANLRALREQLEAAQAGKKAVEETIRKGVETAGKGGGSAGGGVGGGRLINFFSRFGRFLNFSSKYAAVGGAVVTVVGLGLATWGLARLAGSFAGEKSIQAGPRGDKEARIAKGDIPTPQPKASVETSKPSDTAGKTLDTSGDWTLSWNWSVTTVNFVGQVTGGPDNWKFQGSLESGGNYEWTPKKGSATADCTLTGNPLEPSGKGKMNCTATFPDGNWTGDSDGTTNISSYGENKLKFYYEGIGWGTSPTSTRSHIDHLDLKPKDE